jgi:hypothetical protein
MIQAFLRFAQITWTSLLCIPLVFTYVTTLVVVDLYFGSKEVTKEKEDMEWEVVDNKSSKSNMASGRSL